MLKTNTVRCVTDNLNIFNNFKVEKFNKSVPQWFKNIPNYADDSYIKRRSSKYCNGFTEFFKEAYLVKWNSDLYIEFQDEQNFKYYPSENKNNYKNIHWFDSELYGQYTPEQNKRYSNLVLKIATHWSLVANKRSRFLVIDPYFNYKLDARVMTGVFDASKFSELNVMLEIFTKQYNIHRGEAAFCLVPLDGQKIVCDLVNNKDKKHLEKLKFAYDTNIYSSYSKIKDIK